MLAHVVRTQHEQGVPMVVILGNVAALLEEFCIAHVITPEAVVSEVLSRQVSAV